VKPSPLLLYRAEGVGGEPRAEALTVRATITHPILTRSEYESREGHRLCPYKVQLALVRRDDDPLTAVPSVTPCASRSQKFSIIQTLLFEVHSGIAKWRPSGEGRPQS